MSLIITVNEYCHVGPMAHIPLTVRNDIVRLLSFPNPAYGEAQKFGRSTFRIPETISAISKDSTGISMPRGFASKLVTILKKHKCQFNIRDGTRVLPEVDIQFTGKLRDYQVRAVDELAGKRHGTLEASTGSGKTVMALALAAKRRQPTIIVVHTKLLFTQWLKAITNFTNVPLKEIGIITGSRKKRIGTRFTVAMAQTLVKNLTLVTPSTGYLIVDECHRTPSTTFTKIVTGFNCRYLTGLSATQWRRDKLDPLIFWYLGDKSHQTNKNELEAKGHILQAEIIWHDTDYNTDLDASEEYTTMLSELCEDEDRNELITDTIEEELYKVSGLILVLSDRRSHVETLATMLAEINVSAEILLGGTGVKETQRVKDALHSRASRVLIATSNLIGEGFDMPALESLFLTTPIGFDGRLIQYLGRVLRPAKNKSKARVHDFRDLNIGVLKHSAKRRAIAYGEDPDDEEEYYGNGYERNYR
jgi:superfamily II DNA or RNA helicase